MWVLVFAVCGCWFGHVELARPHLARPHVARIGVLCLTELGQKWCLSVLAKFGQMCFLMRGRTE